MNQFQENWYKSLFSKKTYSDPQRNEPKERQKNCHIASKNCLLQFYSTNRFRCTRKYVGKTYSAGQYSSKAEEEKIV